MLSVKINARKKIIEYI